MGEYLAVGALSVDLVITDTDAIGSVIITYIVNIILDIIINIIINIILDIIINI